MINVLIRATLIGEYHKEVLAIISRLRSRAVNEPGFVSSEIVWNQANRQFVWISKWHSREAWKTWRISQDFRSQQRKLDDLGCEISFEILAYPEVDMRKEPRRIGERRVSNDPNFKGPERRSGLDRRLSDDRRKSKK